MEYLITDAVIHLQAQDFTHDAVTKAVRFLLSTTKSGDITHAQSWGFDTSLLGDNSIRSEDALKEFKRLEISMYNNLDNTKHGHELVKQVYNKSISEEALWLSQKANWKKI